MLDLELPIESSRLILRDITHADAKAFSILQFENGVNVNKFIDLRLAAQRKVPRTECGLAVTSKDSGDVLGYIEAAVNDLDDIELRCFIFPEYQGQNYATEACIHLCSALFDFGFEFITGSTTPDNIAAHILMKKLGMVMIGRQETMEYWSLERTPFVIAEIHYKKSLQNAMRAITAG